MGRNINLNVYKFKISTDSDSCKRDVRCTVLHFSSNHIVVDNAFGGPSRVWSSSRSNLQCLRLQVRRATDIKFIHLTLVANWTAYKSWSAARIIISCALSCDPSRGQGEANCSTTREMNSTGTLRRREVSGRNYNDLKEPLLGHRNSSDDDEEEELWRPTTTTAEKAWTYNISRLLAQWAQWFSTVVLAGGFRFTSNLFTAAFGRQSKPEVDLSPLVVARLKKLQERLAIPFDGSLPAHQEALKSLWHASFPERAMPGLVSPQWKDMGWQGNDPSTDFRGGGFVSLENLLFFAERFPGLFQKLLLKAEGTRAEWEYPFAVAGLNITFMLIQLLDLRAAKPSAPSSPSFFNMLAADEDAFDLIYCVAFQMLDQQWLAQGASYMEFNSVLAATRKQLEREFVLEDVDCVEDLPSFTSLVSRS